MRIHLGGAVLADSFVGQVRALLEQQGTDKYAAQALEEFGLEFVNDVPARAQAHFIGRVVALYEENQ